MSYTTIWDVAAIGELWSLIAKVLPPDKAAGTPGRPALPNQQVFNGIVHVLHYHKRKRIQWRWQAIDSKSVAAPLGGEQTGQNPTDRGKLGSKRHILVDARGAPLAIIVSAANIYDKHCARPLVEAVLDLRPPTTYRVHHLCADKGYDFDDVRQGAAEHHYQVHIARKRHRGEPSVVLTHKHKRYPARRWVVERTLSWQNDFRSVRTRWAKQAANWLALIQLASALVLWQMAA